MLKNEIYRVLGFASLTAVLVTGCENLPGTSKQQGAAIGGVGGAVAGAAVGGEHHRVAVQGWDWSKWKAGKG